MIVIINEHVHADMHHTNLKILWGLLCMGNRHIKHTNNCLTFQFYNVESTGTVRPPF